MNRKPRQIQVEVVKWSNRLALRLPAGAARWLGLAAGDKLHAHFLADGHIELVASRRATRAAAARALRRALGRQTISPSVVEEMRRSARY